MAALEQGEIERLYLVALRVTSMTARFARRRQFEAIEDCCHEVFVGKVIDQLERIPAEKREIFVVKWAKWGAIRCLRARQLGALPGGLATAGDGQDDKSETETLKSLLTEAIGQLDPELQDLLHAWLKANGRNSAVTRWASRRGYRRAKGYKLFQKAKQAIRAYVTAQRRRHAR
jgi:hypothetical protein